MGEIQKILDGFNNETLSEDDYCKLAGVTCNFTASMAYKHFQKIAKDRELLAIDLKEYKERFNYKETFNSIIEKFEEGQTDEEAERYCRDPANEHKQGCPCLITLRETLRQVNHENNEEKIREARHLENERIRRLEYDKSMEKYRAEYAVMSSGLDAYKAKAGCLHQFWEFKGNDTLRYFWSDEWCAPAGQGKWQWYQVYTDAHKENRRKQYERENMPPAFVPNPYVPSPRRMIANQCCVNSVITHENAAAFNIMQSCNMSQIFDNSKDNQVTEIIEEQAAKNAALEKDFLEQRLAFNNAKKEADSIKKAAEEEAAAKKAAEEEATAKKTADEEAAAKKKKIIIIIVVVILAVGVMGVSAFIYFNSGNVLKPSSDASSIQLSGASSI